MCAAKLHNMADCGKELDEGEPRLNDILTGLDNELKGMVASLLSQASTFSERMIQLENRMNSLQEAVDVRLFSDTGTQRRREGEGECEWMMRKDGTALRVQCVQVLEKLPTCRGAGASSALGWVARLSRALRSAKVDRADWLPLAASRLRGRAALWWSGQPSRRLHTWDAFVPAFLGWAGQNTTPTRYPPIYNPFLPLYTPESTNNKRNTRSRPPECEYHRETPREVIEDTAYLSRKCVT
ncbi:hypothetical protein AAG570_009349 [Ranatra chinensis]|uniref:Uncharacterized protein n=1 Tax=Ranatra chinensis TaxID=642074 RepID=A0ABD0Z5X3_9HEMI